MDPDHHTRLHLRIDTPRRCLCPGCFRTLTGHAVVYHAGWALCADCSYTASRHDNRYEAAIHRSLVLASLRFARHHLHGRNLHVERGLVHFVPVTRPQRPLWDCPDLRPEWLFIQPAERAEPVVSRPPLGLHHVAR